MNTRHSILSFLLALSSIVAVACTSTATSTQSPPPVDPTVMAPASALVASASPAPSGQKPDKGPGASTGPGAYTMTQTLSDEAQGMTIAFDGLAFLTGNLGSDSFFPPGKVADFWGFQYLRDNDPSQMGHNTDFLTSAALNMYTSCRRRRERSSRPSPRARSVPSTTTATSVSC